MRVRRTGRNTTVGDSLQDCDACQTLEDFYLAAVSLSVGLERILCAVPLAFPRSVAFDRRHAAEVNGRRRAACGCTGGAVASLATQFAAKVALLPSRVCKDHVGVNFFRQVLSGGAKAHTVKTGRRAFGSCGAKASHHRPQNLRVKHLRTCFCITSRETAALSNPLPLSPPPSTSSSPVVQRHTP